jgi:hypothetical protein
MAGCSRAYGEPASGTGHPFDGLWYWALPEGQIEVDFLIKSGKRYVAIEANAKRKYRETTAGLFFPRQQLTHEVYVCIVLAEQASACP